jgi:DNA (cytosine-5)-methyltransferase 1
MEEPPANDPSSLVEKEDGYYSEASQTPHYFPSAKILQRLDRLRLQILDNKEGNSPCPVPPLPKKRRVGADGPIKGAKSRNKMMDVSVASSSSDNDDDKIECIYTVPPNTNMLPKRSKIDPTARNGQQPARTVLSIGDVKAVPTAGDGTVSDANESDYVDLFQSPVTKLFMAFQGVVGSGVNEYALENDQTDSVEVDRVDFQGHTFCKEKCYLCTFKPNCPPVLVGIETLWPSKKAIVSLVVPFEDTLVGTTNDGVDFKADVTPSAYYIVDKCKTVIGLETLSWDAEAEPMTMPEWVYEPQVSPSRLCFAYKLRKCGRPTKPRLQIRSIDLFCGAGGMSVGLQNAGISVAVAVDNNSTACDTYRANHPLCRVLCCKVEDLLKDVSSHIPNISKDEFSHLHASSECVGYSRANWNGCPEKKRTSNEKAYLFVEGIKMLRPDVGTFENVLGLWDRKNQPYLRRILLDLMKERYQVRVYDLKASDYGDPQDRERLFIVASREGVPLPIRPPKTHGPGLIQGMTTEAAIGYMSADNSTVGRKQPRPGSKHEPPKLIADAPSLCIKSSGQLPLHYHHAANGGFITLPEAAALQSFPPTYQFRGNDAEIQRQIGNAVSTRMAEAVGRSVRDVLYWEYETNDA